MILIRTTAESRWRSSANHDPTKKRARRLSPRAFTTEHSDRPTDARREILHRRHHGRRRPTCGSLRRRTSRCRTAESSVGETAIRHCRAMRAIRRMEAVTEASASRARNVVRAGAPVACIRTEAVREMSAEVNRSCVDDRWRIESPAERAVENPVAWDERVSIKPRIPNTNLCLSSWGRTILPSYR